MDSTHGYGRLSLISLVHICWRLCTYAFQHRMEWSFCYLLTCTKGRPALASRYDTPSVLTLVYSFADVLYENLKHTRQTIAYLDIAPKWENLNQHISHKGESSFHCLFPGRESACLANPTKIQALKPR